jgi:hypothetical protein
MVLFLWINRYTHDFITDEGFDSSSAWPRAPSISMRANAGSLGTAGRDPSDRADAGAELDTCGQ